MITKKIAGDLYGNGFMLQDKEGRVFKIDSVHDTCFTVKDEFHVKAVQFVKIGTDYHILARPLDLTKEITHKGETFVPIVELAKVAFPKIKWKLFNQIASSDELDFYFINDFYCDGHAWKDKHIPSQLDLFDKLREWNFAIGFHEGSWIPVTDNNNPYK